MHFGGFAVIESKNQLTDEIYSLFITIIVFKIIHEFKRSIQFNQKGKVCPYIREMLNINLEWSIEN